MIPIGNAIQQNDRRRRMAILSKMEKMNKVLHNTANHCVTVSKVLYRIFDEQNEVTLVHLISPYILRYLCKN